jgi:flagellar hook protein FlgE
MRPTGIVRLYRQEHLIWERQNLFVNTGLPLLANLIAGVTTGQSVSTMGFGSGALAPGATDTGLTAAPTYYNSIGSYSFPSAGSVQFNYSLQTSDYGAAGMTIQELGLFANAAAVTMPAAIGTASPSWSASITVTVGTTIVDGNGNLQRCTAAGTSGSTAPTWSTILGSPTSDGSAVWTLVALHTAPGPMVAHVSVPAFAYTGTGDYSGTWTLTF